MIQLSDYPQLVFVISFFVLSLSGWIGANFLRKLRKWDEGKREDFELIMGATLTLLGLIIGFVFYGVIRYDQRKNYEEAEANAIGTEYVREDLFPSADAAKVRELLKDYVDQRVRVYATRGRRRLFRSIPPRRNYKLSCGRGSRSAGSQPTPMVSLAVSGMNDVLNSQEYTQASWSNRIPTAAWLLMAAIAICCNLLLGYSSRDGKAVSFLLQVLPMIVSVSFFLIADFDSPRGGVILVHPENLLKPGRIFARALRRKRASALMGFGRNRNQAGILTGEVKQWKSTELRPKN